MAVTNLPYIWYQYVRSKHMLSDAEIAAISDALRDAELFEWFCEHCMAYQRSGPHYGWGTDELLPGETPWDAIYTFRDRAIAEERAA